MAAVIIQEPGKQTPLQLGDKLSVIGLFPFLFSNYTAYVKIFIKKNL